MLEKYGDFITLEDLCEILTIGKSTAYNLLQTREINAFKIGRIWKIPKFVVVDYIERQINVPIQKGVTYER